MNYDVVIIGGGTAGCSCAYNCAKLGLKTLLLEKESYLGGTMTGGLVVPVMKSGENQINTDFYKLLIKEMSKNKAQVTYQDNPGWFNPIILKDVLYNLLKSVKVDIKFNSCATHADVKNNKILSVYYDTIHTNNVQLANNILSVCIEANYIVDASGNLDFSKNINCNFLENKNEIPPISFRFIMSGIDNRKFAQWLSEYDKDRDVTTVEYMDNEPYFSTAYTWDSDKHWALAPLFDDAVSKNILKDTDRNYFQIFSIAGCPQSVAFNCPRLLENYNLEDKEDIKRAKTDGVCAISRIAKFCNIYLPGFENAYITKIADMLGVRAYRRIKGKYVYTIDDLRSGKKFDNPVLISNYPVDVHSKDKNSSTLEMTGEYQLPIESLMSADYDNLFIAGRGLSADEMAQGALRVQSSCFSMGEAVAKYIKTQLT
ncbi:FAD-dependent oxidoreductase [bacterium]|nr:FAD-dependent oxidoreductase [bacterium]